MVPNDPDNPTTKNDLIPKMSWECEFQSRMLGLEFPFYVDKVSWFFEDFKLVVHINYPPEALFTCECGHKNLSKETIRPMKWRHLDALNYKAILEMDVPTVKCPSCNKIKTIQIPWARPHSHVTKLMEEKILFIASKSTIPSAAKLIGISRRLVTQTVKHYEKQASAKSD